MMTNETLIVIALLTGCIGGTTFFFLFLMWQKKVDERHARQEEKQMKSLTDFLIEDRMDALIKERIDALLNERIEKRIIKMICEHQQQSPTVMQTVFDRSIKLEERRTALYSFMMTYYPEFLKLLRAQLNTTLTKTEETVCILTKLGLGNQQIAQALTVEKPTLTKMRSRIRQKMKQDPGSRDFHQWMNQLGEPLGQLPPGHLIYGTGSGTRQVTNREEQTNNSSN